ncbi:MAG: hypothetical protein AAB492_04365 [Patescibacteria group bacterium]
MRKKLHHKKSKAVRTRKPKESFLVLIRSWMLLVMFALMLGLGAVVGTFFNDKTAESAPTVAGVSIEAN